MANLEKLDAWQKDFQTQLMLAQDQNAIDTLDSIKKRLIEFEEKYENRLDEPRIADLYAEMKKEYVVWNSYVKDIEARKKQRNAVINPSYTEKPATREEEFKDLFNLALRGDGSKQRKEIDELVEKMKDFQIHAKSHERGNGEYIQIVNRLAVVSQELADIERTRV